MTHLILLPVLLPLLTGAILLLITGKEVRAIRIVSLCGGLVCLVASLALLHSVLHGEVVIYRLGNWPSPFAITLVADLLSGLMLVVSSLLACACLLFAGRDKDAPVSRFHSLFHFLCMGIHGAFLTGDLFNLFVFFEVLLISSYGLLVTLSGRPKSRNALHFVILNMTGTVLFLVAIGLIYRATGRLNLADVAAIVPHLSDGGQMVVQSASFLLMVVFGLKAAVFPLCFWLPQTYPSAPVAATAMFNIVSKVGLYAIWRWNFLIFGHDHANDIWSLLWLLGLLTMAVGSAGTLAGRSLKEQFSFLILLSIGLLLAGASLSVQQNNPLLMAAVLCYLIQSTLIGGTLFLWTDWTSQAKSSPAYLLVRHPVVTVLFVVIAITVSGLPPLSGFVGKVLLLSSAGIQNNAMWLWLAVVLSSIAVLIAMVRLGSRLFWYPANPAPAPDIVVDRGQLVAVTGLASVALAFPFYADTLFLYCRTAADLLFHPAPYLRAVLEHSALHSVLE